MRHAHKKPPQKLLMLWAAISIVILFMLSLPFWATDEADAKATLEALSLTPVKIGGYDSFGCGLDLFATQFIATTPAGKTVRGDVCYTPGISKSSVEFDNRK